MATVVGTDESAKRRVTCRNCASIIEYTPADTREVMVRDYTGDGELTRFLKCPKCGDEFAVSR